MTVHDLNWRAHWSLGRGVILLPREPRRSCVRRSFRVFAADGFFATSAVHCLCESLARRSPAARLLVPRSISLSRIRAADVSRKLARYRDLSASGGTEAVPRWISREDFAQHAGRRKSHARLAHLGRLRPGVDSPRAAVVCERTTGSGTGTNGLCSRREHDRSLFEPVPLGAVGKAR